MMEPFDMAGFDQKVTLVLDTQPQLWRSLYVKLVEVGFSEDQAMTLLKTYVAASVSGVNR